MDNAPHPGKQYAAAGIVLTFVAALILAWISYGDIDGRGLYADDFVFGWISQHLGYTDAIIWWRETATAGGRVFLGAITPLIYGYFGEPGLLDSNLTGFHAFLVIVHLINTLLLWLLLRRSGAGDLASGSAMLLFLLHPAKNRAILWPAAAYGYGIGLMCFLAGWLLLQPERRRSRLAFVAGSILWLCAALSIEQFIVIEVGLLCWWALRSRLDRDTSSPAWHHLLLAVSIATVFLFAHFGSGEATTGRLQDYAGKAGHESGIVHQLGEAARITAWRLNTAPVHSPYADSWRSGTDIIRSEPTTFALAVSALILLAGSLAWTTLHRGAAPARVDSNLLIHGMIVFGASLAPFIVLGMGAGPGRTTLIVLVGIAIIVAWTVQTLISSLAHTKTAIRNSAVLLIAACLIPYGWSTLVINQGDQQLFARDWERQRQVLLALEALDLQGGELIIVKGGEPPLYGNSWGFPNAVKWLTHDDSTEGWNPYMRLPAPKPPADKPTVTLDLGP